MEREFKRSVSKVVAKSVTESCPTKGKNTSYILSIVTETITLIQERQRISPTVFPTILLSHRSLFSPTPTLKSPIGPLRSESPRLSSQSVGPDGPGVVSRDLSKVGRSRGFLSGGGVEVGDMSQVGGGVV